MGNVEKLELQSGVRADEWVFVSPHPPDKSESIIRDVRAPRSLFGGTGVRGSVGGGRLRLYHVQRGRQNSFVPVFDGRIEPSGFGSRIVGKFRLHLAVRVFMMFWMGGVACFFLFGVVHAIVNLAGGESKGEDAIFVAIPLLMLFFGAGLLTFGRYGMGAKSETETVDLIVSAIEGTIEQQPDPTTSRSFLPRRVPATIIASLASDFSRVRMREMARTPKGLALLAASYSAAGVLMYVWMRPGLTGCAGDHKFDPHYYCPGDISFVIWLTMVGAMAIGAFGALMWVRQRWPLLYVAIGLQLVLVGVGIGYVNYLPMQPHPFPAGKTDSPSEP